MQIVRAKILGMCMGVRRAEQIARNAAESAKESGCQVFTYGPLIHNPQAVLSLERLGVKVLDPEIVLKGELPNLNNAVVIIRAHGAPQEVFERLRENGAEVIDATCPRVIRSQELARRYEKEGWQVVLAGDSKHGEIAGILGHIEHGFVVESADQAKVLAQDWKHYRVALIAQTTIREEEYASIAEVLKNNISECEAEWTICPATRERQEALADLCNHVDAVLVVGGKNSANTRRLYAAVIERGMPAWHIETALEIVPDMARYERVGLAAGASTPDSIIDDVEKTLEQLGAEVRKYP